MLEIPADFRPEKTISTVFGWSGSAAKSDAGLDRSRIAPTSTGNLTNNLNLEVTTPDGTFKGMFSAMVNR
jgi:hypothetical protein